MKILISGAFQFCPIFIPLFGRKVSGVPPVADSEYAIASTIPLMKLHCEQYFTAEIAKIAEKIIRQLNS